jgi:solute carrier family 35 protein E3
MGKLHFFEISHTLPTVEAWKMSFFGVASIVSMNFNLQTNSIGFYQLSKLCTIPCLVVYRRLILGQTTPTRTLASLTVLLAGLYLFTVNDVQFNVVGSVIAVVAVVTTAAYQTMTNTLQNAFAVNGTQLSHRVSFPQFVICFVAALVIETHGTMSITAQQFYPEKVAMILVTGMLAVIANVIGFSLIGRAGPITFQVVGHVKTMMIFVNGLVLFSEREETTAQLFKKIVGLAVSMSGVVLYTVFEIHTKKTEEIERLLAVKIPTQPEFETVEEEQIVHE